MYNSIQVAKALVEDGANVKAVDSGNRTPLHITANCGHNEIAGVLMTAGANPNAKNNFGFIPLEMDFIQKIKKDLDRKQQEERLAQLGTPRNKRRIITEPNQSNQPNSKKRIRRSNWF